MYKRTENGWSKHFDFMLSDLLCICFAFFCAYGIRHGLVNPMHNQVYEDFFIFLFIIHIILVFFAEPYSGILRRGQLQEFKCTVTYSVMVMAVVVIYLFAVKHGDEFSRMVLGIFWVLSIFYMYLARIGLKRYLQYKSKSSKNALYMVLVTKRSLAEYIIDIIQNNPYSNTILNSIVITDEDMTGQEIRDIPVVAARDTMLEYCRTHVVDKVLMNTREEWTYPIVNTLVNMGITVHINVNRIASDYPNCTVEKVNGVNVLTTSINATTDRQFFLKRTMDILGGLVGLILCGIAFLFVAPITKRQSPGPVFFKQKRVGKNGRIFYLYKFRSMYLDAEERKKEMMDKNEMQGLMFKMKDDPRIFPFGHFLRNSSIDELPQFWNVLKGEMSLVGTRPPTLDEYEQYDLGHKSRLATKPGITGMWQVSGRSDITDFDEVVRLDNEYIRHWTLGLDFKIVWKTVLVILKKDGAR